MTLDGENVTHFTLDSVREQIGIVLQQPILFGTTIRSLMELNKLNESAIYAGQILLVK